MHTSFKLEYPRNQFADKGGLKRGFKWCFGNTFKLLLHSNKALNNFEGFTLLLVQNKERFKFLRN